ncbi:MAG TPA: tetratricopeptide repeat protein, partial [Pyrinomonadaceae bacterium]|nr:tetratricopeptide repeat protein [Pyrinomonadaceae bacterium]
MSGSIQSGRKILYALALLAMLFCFQSAFSQSDDATDPVKLFEQGQDAHAKRNYQRAIELYDAALKLKPE